MASSTALKDLEENFFLCPVCLEIFYDPKLLPCLHRYCAKCLRTLINSTFDKTIKCPMCKQQCDVPDNGIDGFKTDFYMKTVVEFIQRQRMFENKDLKKCVSCSNEKTISAYCSKCKDFLCEQCYKVHISSKMFTDHKPRTLKLDNTDGRNITLENLVTLSDDPRCKTHVEEIAKLCCSTCENELICILCTYSKHKGHDLHDVTELATIERELLESKIAELQKLKSKLYELPKNVEATKQKLKENVSMKTDILMNQHQEQVNKIKNKLEERRSRKVQGLTDIEKRRTNEEMQTNLSYEEEINELNKKYDEIRKGTTRKYNNEQQLFKDSCEKIESELSSKVESLNMNLKSITESKALLVEDCKKELAKISENCNQVIERYENFSEIASSILTSGNEWAQIHCIPDIRAACEPLVERIKTGYPQLNSLSDIPIGGMPNLVLCDVSVSGQEQTVIEVEGLKAMGWTVNGIASSRNGTIAISGTVSNEYSHITVINRKGKIQRQDQIKKKKKSTFSPSRLCCYLSYFKVATVCIPDEIGVFSVRDGSYNKKYMKDIIRGWSAVRKVRCIANDPVKSHIIVGTNSRYVYKFDDHLKHIHTITLPDGINGVNDITVHKGMLLICDYDGKGAYAVTAVGTESKLMYEFTKPDLDGCNVGPFRVCTDKNDLIYMLWRSNAFDQLIYTLVCYSHDGKQILTARQVDNDAICLSTLNFEGREKLLIATSTSGKIYENDI